MNRQRKTSFGMPKRESMHGMSAVRATPLTRSSSGKRSTFSSAKRNTLSATKPNQRTSYLGVPDVHIVKDTRPLGDKSYTKRLVGELIALLTDLGFPSSVNARMLNPPTNKVYQQIFEFLVSHILGSYKILGRPDEEMLKLVKDLGYPYNISKSTLNNVGTMSAWPQAIGLLSWICELVKYWKELSNAPNIGFDDDVRKQTKVSFLYVMYEEFMLGNDGPYHELNEKVKQQLSELDKDAAAELKDFERANAQLNQDCEKKIEEKECNSRLTDEISTQKSNTNKMLAYFDQIDDYLKKMQEKAEEHRQAAENRKLQVEEEKQNIVKLKTTIAVQKMKPADVEKLTLEKKQLQDMLTSESDRGTNLKNAQWDGEIQFGKVVLSVDEMVHKHNDDIRKLRETLSHGFDKLKGELETVPSDEDYYLVTGYNGVEKNNSRLLLSVKPYLTDLNNKLLALQRTLDTEHHNSDKRIRQDKEMVSDIEARNQILQQQSDKITVDSGNYEKERNRQELMAKAELECKIQELDQLKALRSESIEEIEEKLKKKSEEVKQFAQTFEEKESQYKECLNEMVKHLKKFQSDTQIMLEKFDEQMKVAKTDFGEKLQKLSAKEKQLATTLSEITN